MDTALRISKVEGALETNQKEIDRQHDTISELRTILLEQSTRHDQRTDELRKEMAAGFERQDQRTDQLRKEMVAGSERHGRHIDLLREHTDRRFDQLRRELALNLHWMMGIWITTMGLVIGVAGKALGLY